jgi:hypothetical protein
MGTFDDTWVTAAQLWTKNKNFRRLFFFAKIHQHLIEGKKIHKKFKKKIHKISILFLVLGQSFVNIPMFAFKKSCHQFILSLFWVAC